MFLVRWMYGERPRVYKLKQPRRPRSWRFKGGLAVTDTSLVDALEKAQRMSVVRPV